MKIHFLKFIKGHGNSDTLPPPARGMDTGKQKKIATSCIPKFIVKAVLRV